MHRNLLAGNELRAELPEALRELEILLAGGKFHAAGEFEELACEGVAEGGLVFSLAYGSQIGLPGMTYFVLDIGTVVLGRKEVRDYATFRGDGLAGDIGRCTF